MNSRKTLTCNLCSLPPDIFRIIFQFLSVDELMDGEEAFLNNQELLSLYRSAFEGFTLKEIISNGDKDDKLISWIIDRKLLVETLEIFCLGDLEMNLLNQTNSSLKSIYFSSIDPDSDNSVPVIPSFGHFPLLTSVTIEVSDYFTDDILISFFSQSPQLEIVKIDEMSHLSNEFLPHLSNSCPNIKILSLVANDWVDDETMSLLSQQRLFPNLKSLDMQQTRIRNEESLHQFMLSHPLLSGIHLPDDIEYSDEFLLFYLTEVIFPSILNQHNDLESHSLAVSSLWNCFSEHILDGRFDVVNPEIFSMDIFYHLRYKNCPVETLNQSSDIIGYLSEFPSM